MAEKTSKKMNFFKDVIKSIKDLDKYEDYALELPKNAFKYLFKLVLLFCVIICACYTCEIVDSMNNLYKDFIEIIPDFSYKNGIIEMDSKDPIIFEKYKETFGKVVIDINGNLEDYEKSNDVGILVLKDKLIILSNQGMGQVVYNYQDMAESYEITDFNKQDIINYVENVNIISLYVSVYFAIYIYLFIIYFIAILMDVLLLSILAYLVSRISKIRLKFAPSFSIAVHAITLSITLNLIYIIVNLFTGFEVKYFQLMYSTISYIYVIVAILMIKTDFLQRQIELIKLAEEQEKVREELKEQEEEDKNKKQDEDKEEKKEHKKSEDEDVPEANAPACEELEEQP